MKKLILISAFFFLTLLINAQVKKPLRGYYAKITKDSLFIPTGVLKTSFWVEIDSLPKFNIAKVGWDQTLKIELTFKIYESYYRYWNFYAPINYPISSFLIQNIDIFGGIDLETWLPTNIRSNLATIFQVPESSITMYSYY